MDRLMKHTEENVLKQQALDKKAGVDKNVKSGRSSQVKPKSSSDSKLDDEETKNNVSKGKKRKADLDIEKNNSATEKHLKIQIPSTLKMQLVDDWEFITQQNKLVKLPRSPSVEDIIAKYLDYRSKKDGTPSRRLITCNSIRIRMVQKRDDQLKDRDMALLRQYPFLSFLIKNIYSAPLVKSNSD